MDLSKKNVKELIEICKERGVKGYSKLKKDEILKRLSSPITTEEKKEKVKGKTKGKKNEKRKEKEKGKEKEKIKEKIKEKNELVWNPWTEKSKDIRFKTTKKGLGDGEEKVASELDTVVLGQNSPHDIEIVKEGITIKYDVKKLDRQDDFNTGVKGRDRLRPIKHLHLTLLELIKTYRDGNGNDIPKEEISKLIDVSPDELAVGTLNRMNRVCTMFHQRKNKIREKMPMIEPYSDNEGKKIKMPLDIYYDHCKKLNKPFPEEYSSFENDILQLRDMEHPYINEPEKFMRDLHSLTDMFYDVKIIIVDSKKGYVIVDDVDTKIRFLRITRGSPRFQIV